MDILKKIQEHLSQPQNQQQQLELSIFQSQFHVYGAGLYTTDADTGTIPWQGGYVHVRELPKGALTHAPSCLFVDLI
ncbi:hypothetical protein EON63_05660 [archaeon]|nr:MAG: hypothetical protein EON63_05660 [archaeon]